MARLRAGSLGGRRIERDYAIVAASPASAYNKPVLLGKLEARRETLSGYAAIPPPIGVNGLAGIALVKGKVTTAAVLLLAFAGLLRSSEVMQLQFSDFAFFKRSRRFLFVLSGTKSENCHLRPLHCQYRALGKR